MKKMQKSVNNNDDEDSIIVYHDSEDCEGRPCVFHNPSDHPLNKAPTSIRFDRPIYVGGKPDRPPVYLTERICEHGVGHPDPDSMDWLLSIGADEAERSHFCDGCCW